MHCKGQQINMRKKYPERDFVSFEKSSLGALKGCTAWGMYAVRVWFYTI